MRRVSAIVLGIGSLLSGACSSDPDEEIRYEDLELSSGSPREALVAYLESVRHAGWDEAQRFCWSPSPPAAEVGFGGSLEGEQGYTLRLERIEAADHVWYEVDLGEGERWSLALRSAEDGWKLDLSSAEASAELRPAAPPGPSD